MSAIQPATNSTVANGENIQSCKRMVLSEVYVHRKRRKISNDETQDDYDVFHIFEVVEPNVTIQPRLATNCNEREKVVEALQCASGSDTPQMQRLIKRLSEACKCSKGPHF